MKFTLRPYQEQAILAVKQALIAKDNCLLTAPCAAGISLVDISVCGIMCLPFRTSHPIGHHLHRTTYGSAINVSCQSSQFSYSINPSRMDLLSRDKNGECRSVVGPDLCGFPVYEGPIMSRPAGKPYKDETGKKYDRLTVLSLHGQHSSLNYLWLCQCECGNTTIVKGVDLRNHVTKSCGCLVGDSARERMTTHGKSRTPEYVTWINMKGRCYDEKNEFYSDYGGRGIAVCDEWLHDFEQFLFDMGTKPSKHHSIDRKDNNGPYCKDNCRWATGNTQARNRRDTRMITLFDETLSLRDWCELLNRHYRTVKGRLNLYGWSPEKALLTPTPPNRKRMRENA